MSILERIVINKNYNDSNLITYDKFEDDIQDGKYLREGEIIICTDYNNPGMYTFTSDVIDPLSGNILKSGKIVRVTGPETVTLSSAYTMSDLSGNNLKVVSGQTLETALGVLEKLIKDKHEHVHAELDIVEQSIGLDNYGNYQQSNGNYTNEATSIVEEISALDNALKLVDDASIEHITINGVDAAVQKNHAQVRLGGKNITLTDYFSGETYNSIVSDDTINSAFGKLENKNKLLQNELDNTQKGSGLSNDGSYIKTDKVYISGATSIHEATEMLNDAIADIQSQVIANTFYSDENTVIVSQSPKGVNLDVNVDFDTIIHDNGELKTNITVQRVYDNLAANVRECYALISGDGHELGNRINVYKDSSLVKTELGKTSWTIDPNTGEYTYKGTDGNDAIVFVYEMSDGSFTIAAIDVSKFLTDAKFGNGLKVENGTISIESHTPNYLEVNSSTIGVKVSSIAGALSNADGLPTAYDVKEYTKALSETVTNNVVNISNWTVNGYEIGNYEVNKPVILDGYDIKLSFEDKMNPDRTDHNHNYSQTTASGSGINILVDDNVSTAISKISQNIDLIQLGSGLENDGQYTKNTTANYINAALSLKDADNKLDAALKSEETIRIESDELLQNELDNTQKGGGLSNDGSYIKNETSNYIGNATSLNNADVLLDNALKTEENARITKDEDLENKINVLRTDASSSANTLYNAINTESKNRSDEDIKINNLIQTLSNNTSNNINSLNTAINTEKDDRTKGDKNLQDQLDTLNNTTIPNINSNITNLSASTVALSAATSQNFINEKNSREQSDKDINERIDNLTVNISTNYLPLSGGTMSNSNVVNNLNADLLDGLHVNDNTNSEANAIVRTDANGYIQASYIHYNSHEKLNTNPSYICGFNDNDNYIRTYNINELNVKHAVSANTSISATTSASASVAAKVNGTLTLNEGTFNGQTYNGEKNVSVNIPTKTSHISNDSGYLTAQSNEIITLQTDLSNLTTNVNASVQTLTLGLETETLNRNTSINTINNTINDITDNISTLSGHVKSNINKIEELSGNVKTNITNINTLSGHVANNITNINAVSTKAETNRINVNTLSGHVADNITNISTLSGHVKTNISNIETLIGTDINMSVRNIVIDEVTKQLDSEEISESFDTLKEIAEYLTDHPDIVTDINSNINTLSGHVKSNISRIEVLENSNFITSADTVANANNATKVSNSLTFGSKTYDGSAARTITANDLGAITQHQSIYELKMESGSFSPKTFTPNVTGKTINIPTKTSHLENDNNFINSGVTVANANNAGKVSNALTFGSKTYNGSAARTITAEDLGAITEHQLIYNLSMEPGMFSARTFEPTSEDKTVNIPTSTTHLTNDDGFITLDDLLWNNIDGKPETFTPSTHDHDNLYYRKDYLNTQLSGKAESGHTHRTINNDLTVVGDVNANAFYETSDENLKIFKGDVEVDFEKLKLIPKQYFIWKNDESNEVFIGTGAQTLETIYPEMVKTNLDGTKRVDYTRLTIPLLKAVDMLYEENKMLKERLDKIEKLLGDK